VESAEVAVESPASGGDSFRIEPHVWRIAFVVILGAIMSILDTTIVNVALKTLGDDLDAPLASVQWVLTGYMLSLAAVIPITGWAARRFGPRNVYMLSLVLFTAGSMLCGLATSVGELTFFRVLQGIGGGMLLPIGQLMMANAAGPQRMGRVMSVVAIPAMLAPILGPALGGVIVDNLSWQWIFYVNVPIGIVALIAAIRILPKGDRSPAGKLDVRGLALMSTGLPLLTYGLAEIGATGHFLVPKVVVPLIAGVALIVAFVFHALRIKNPLLDLHLYRRPTFAAASACMFLLGGALFGGLVLLPLYWQDVRGESVAYTGLLTAPMGIGMVLVMPLAGRLTDRFGGGLLALIGVTITTIATIPFALIGAGTSIAALSGAMVIRGVGVGLAFIPAMTAAYASLNRSELPDAAPQLNVLQRVGGSIGTAVLAVVLQRALAGAISPSEMAAAFGTAFWWTTGITAIAIVPCFLLMRAERAAKRHALDAPIGGLVEVT
jgi:EmrB/QacA subfamily drug resistance transporter